MRPILAHSILFSLLALLLPLQASAKPVALETRQEPGQLITVTENGSRVGILKVNPTNGATQVVLYQSSPGTYTSFSLDSRGHLYSLIPRIWPSEMNFDIYQTGTCQSWGALMFGDAVRLPQGPCQQQQPTFNRNTTTGELFFIPAKGDVQSASFQNCARGNFIAWGPPIDGCTPAQLFLTSSSPREGNIDV